jgi:NAD-dependent aldehyde dehydrogenases
MEFPDRDPGLEDRAALAYGNTVVIKPADLVPGSTWALVDILHRAGLPKGVINLVIGRGTEVGVVLLEHPDVAAISFTGSVSTGQKVAAACIASRPMKKFQLEMGGKNPLVVSMTPISRSRWNAPPTARSFPPASAARRFAA